MIKSIRKFLDREAKIFELEGQVKTLKQYEERFFDQYNANDREREWFDSELKIKQDEYTVLAEKYAQLLRDVTLIKAFQKDET